MYTGNETENGRTRMRFSIGISIRIAVCAVALKLKMLLKNVVAGGISEHLASRRLRWRYARLMTSTTVGSI